MAELALLASIVQIADTGYRLSLKLYTSGEAISSADRTIITISKDISLTSTVLKELGEILRRDQEEKERICSENLIQTAGNTVKECLDAFEELDKMILKNMPNLSQGHRATRATMALEKLKWPFIQPRVQLLRGSLDMLRANISLMLNVLIYARHVSDRKKLRAPAPDVYDEARQKTIIEELVNAKDEYVRKFESLKLSTPASPSTQTVHNIGSRAAPAPTEENVVPTQHTSNTLPTTTFQYIPTPPFNPSSVNTFQNAPAPQHTSNTFSTNASQNTPTPPFNPSSVNTFRYAPAPQHTSSTFSANTSQNTPAQQWPLPNIPASYPTMPMDPVAVRSDQYSSWLLLHHLNTLVASLIREVSSPVYQISAESRSRFTGVIRATYTTEIVEAERSEPRRYWHHWKPSATLHSNMRRPASPQYEPSEPHYGYGFPARQSSGPSNLFVPIPASDTRHSAPPPIRRPSVHQQASWGAMERTYFQSPSKEHEDDEEQPAIKRLKTAEVSASTSDSDGYEPESFMDQYDENQHEVPEPERNDVVYEPSGVNLNAPSVTEKRQRLEYKGPYRAEPRQDEDTYSGSHKEQRQDVHPVVLEEPRFDLVLNPFAPRPAAYKRQKPETIDVVDDLVKLWTLVR